MTRLSAERLDELYRGTLALVAEHGFERITMDQVAEATRSSKATLYRQWGSKSRLVAEALRCVTIHDDPVLDTGSFRGDLIATVAQRSERVESDADLIVAVLQAVKADRELADAVRDQVLSDLDERLEAMVGQAVARGEIDADAPALAFLDLTLVAPFVLRTLLDGVPVDEEYLTGYIDAVLLPALGVATTNRS